jgi:hypothetical protein
MAAAAVFGHPVGMTLDPKGEPLRRALRWISDQRQAVPDADIKKLVAEAGLRFDLTPPDQEFLWHTLVQGGGEPSGGI